MKSSIIIFLIFAAIILTGTGILFACTSSPATGIVFVSTDIDDMIKQCNIIINHGPHWPWVMVLLSGLSLSFFSYMLNRYCPRNFIEVDRKWYKENNKNRHEYEHETV